MEHIHPHALVQPGAVFGEGIEVGPFAVVEDAVTLGDSVYIGPHAVIRRGSILEAGVRVEAHAVVGGPPQDGSFDLGTPTGVHLGTGCVIREGVTVNRATQTHAPTTIGAHSMLMAYAHVGHDGQVGNHVILANNVMLAGFVTIGDHAFIGGGSGIHQHARVGESCMMSGLTRASGDAPPFCMVAERNQVIGLNLVGLKRRKLPREDIRDLKACYRAIFEGSPNLRKNAEAAREDGLGHTPVGAHFLAFFEAQSRGFMRPRTADA